MNIDSPKGSEMIIKIDDNNKGYEGWINWDIN
jgi:hypothetical protein